MPIPRPPADSGPQGVGQQSMNTTSGLPNGIANFNDPQKNLFLDPSQIAQGLASDGSQGGRELRVFRGDAVRLWNPTQG